jgi:hypothetical protein
MTTTEPTGYAAIVIANAKRLAKSTKQDWPGMPLTQIPLSFKDDLQSLIRDGHVTLVERPRSHGRSGTVRYIVAT